MRFCRGGWLGSSAQRERGRRRRRGTLHAVEPAVEEQSRDVLELSLVLDQIAAESVWSRGREAVLALYPLASLDDVRARQAEVAEAIRFDEQMSVPPLRGVRDIRAHAEMARKGGVLEPSVLLDVGNTLRVAVQTRAFLLERAQTAPRKAARAEVLSVHPDIVRHIEGTLTSEGEVRETASARLEDIRVRIRTLQNKIGGRMQAVLRNPAVARMLQEPYVTTRQDRYVVPVKAEYRGVFEGLVHDASASGATVFMEPLAVVDLDNDLRALRIDESHEVERILRALSERVGAVCDDVCANDEILAHLDMLMATARHASKTHASLVLVEERPRVTLRKARHPLLGARAVPIDLDVGSPPEGGDGGGGCRVLVVTGPNTGGKTVSLKTVGLVVLMAMCGLPVPVGEGSRIGFFRGVYADIGDEQSIHQNLSTFSAHLLQISRIVSKAGQGTLVLLDELGAGTDPREGAGLAVSILEHLHALGALVICTTHHNDLKAFASGYDGAMNAAMEFDPRTLQPTYRILQGLPGRSCALEISERLGLPAAVLSRARELLGTAHFEVEDLLASLEHERDEVNRLAVETRRAHHDAESARARLAEELDALERTRDERMSQALDEARAMLESTRGEMARLLAETRARLESVIAREQRLQENAAKAQETPDTRSRDSNAAASPVEAEGGEASLEHLAGASTAATDALRAVSSAIEAAASRNEASRRRRAAEAAPRPAEESVGLSVGDTVWVERIGQEARVDALGRDDVVVRAGTLRMTLPLAQVRRLRGGTSLPSAVGEVVVKTAGGSGGAERRANVSTRLDIRGMRAEDAVYEVDRYLDEASLAHVEQATIVHGKGTGVLLNVVQERLRAHPRVDAFRPGDPGEGGWGVTVVRMR